MHATVNEMQKRLLASAKAGDHASFEALLREAGCAQLCLRVLEDVTDAADAWQEAQVEAWQQVPSFNGKDPAQFYAWLNTITKRVCYRHIKQRQRRRAVMQDGGPTAAELLLPDPNAAAVLHAIESNDFALQLVEGIYRRLNEQDRLLFHHRYAGMTFSAIATLPGLRLKSAAQWEDHWNDNVHPRLEEAFVEVVLTARSGSKWNPGDSCLVAARLVGGTKMALLEKLGRAQGLRTWRAGEYQRRIAPVLTQIGLSANVVAIAEHIDPPWSSEEWLLYRSFVHDGTDLHQLPHLGRTAAVRDRYERRVRPVVLSAVRGLNNA